MNGKIISKRYYRVTFVLASAMAVGSGENDVTDKDLIRDGRGVPYVPATALAGIYRGLLGREQAEKYFGKIDMAADASPKAAPGRQAQESRIIVYDAVLSGGDYHVSIRDCVGLDEWKTGKPGAKFDFEILEPGAEFITYIEQDKYEGDENVGDALAQGWLNGSVTIGGKESRGLGRVRDVTADVLEFSFLDPREISDWLDFRVYEKDSWDRCLKTAHRRTIQETSLIREASRIHLKVRLRQRSPLTIRVYTTKVNEDGNMPDYQQMVYLRGRDKKQEVPVIPGTSWAGAFRHQMLRLDESSVGEHFGNMNKRKSEIYFEESEITNACGKLVTRNAINRFTGGAADAALYTEKMFYGGETVLGISLPRGAEYDGLFRCLAAALADLHMGILALGGETSVGHGLFLVKEIFCQGTSVYRNDREAEELPMPDQAEEIYESLCAWKRQEGGV